LPPEAMDQGQAGWTEAPFKPKDIWAIRIRAQLSRRIRDLALFSLAIDSKLRGRDLLSLRVGDVARGGRVVPRATVVQSKTGHVVRFEPTEQTRDAVEAWIAAAGLRSEQLLFPSRLADSPRFSTRRYSRIVKGWAVLISLDRENYGTHSLRRTKAKLFYRRTKILRAVPLLLGHIKLESTGILGSRWTMPWKWPSRAESDRPERGSGPPFRPAPTFPGQGLKFRDSCHSPARAAVATGAYRP